jgi:hypothetical protein
MTFCADLNLGITRQALHKATWRDTLFVKKVR